MRTVLAAAVIIAVGPAAALSGQSIPSPRLWSAAAYDGARHRLILHGGADELEGVLGDTWEWNGREWRQLTLTLSPSPRAAHLMAYDPIRNVVVLFGGADDNGPRNDTWVFNGMVWKEMTPDPSPAARLAGTMVWNPDRKAMTLIGGQGEELLGDVWEWDGLRWTQLSASPAVVVSPPSAGSTRARAMEAMVKADLRNLVTAQEAFFADNSRYARTMEELGTMYQASEGVTVKFGGAGDSSYDATGTHAELNGGRCVIYVGDRPAGFPGDLVEGAPRCEGFR